MGRWPRLLAPPTKPNQWGNEKCYPYNINHHFELFFPQKVVLKFGCILLYHSKLLIVGCHSFGFFHHFEQFLVWLTEFYFSDIVFFFQNWISASISKPVINQTAAFLIESFLSLSLPLCLSLSLSLLILNYLYKYFFYVWYYFWNVVVFDWRTCIHLEGTLSIFILNAPSVKAWIA